MKVEFTKFCYRAAANSMKINICHTTKAAKSLHVPLFLHKRLKTTNEGVPYYSYALFIHEVKEHFEKLAGAKEKQTESSARALQQKREKKNLKLPDYNKKQTGVGEK